MQMTQQLAKIQSDIEAIKARNKRVEADKAWELSRTRKILVTVLTYLVIVVFMIMAKLEKPFITALIPSLAYLISMSTLYYLKKWWTAKFKK